MPTSQTLGLCGSGLWMMSMRTPSMSLSWDGHIRLLQAACHLVIRGVICSSLVATTRSLIRKLVSGFTQMAALASRSSRAIARHTAQGVQNHLQLWTCSAYHAKRSRIAATGMPPHHLIPRSPSVSHPWTPGAHRFWVTWQTCQRSSSTSRPSRGAQSSAVASSASSCTHLPNGTLIPLAELPCGPARDPMVVATARPHTVLLRRWLAAPSSESPSTPSTS
mmetsp:Transcript_93720/g.274456  ORF Transcript_93720/g.274456 Transcript_93720/m.274456 type:complete len:221 (+) Transcript_93720:197-859(+)